jgi:hypothetical protein
MIRRPSRLLRSSRRHRGLAFGRTRRRRASVEPGIAAQPVSVSVRQRQPPHPLRRRRQHPCEAAGKGIGTLPDPRRASALYLACQTDSTAPDFTACDMSQRPAAFPFAPRTVVLHEDADIRLVGHTFPSFWRPEVVDFEVGGRTEWVCIWCN